MKVFVIVPTFNEVKNIGRLIDTVTSVFARIPNHECHLLVVDANSPDGTAGVVASAGEQLPFVHLLLEKGKQGLGAAYTQGFKKAMEMGADVVVEMDADFQHDPNDIKRMLEQIDAGYDYVIGSRFVKGGTIPNDWAFYRKFLSIGGNVFSKIVLGVYNVADFTSGFKASRVKGFVDKLDLDHLLSGGFAYKIELLYRMHKLGAKIIEIPIKFGLRDRGDSKMEKNNMLDSIRVVLQIRLRQNKNFVKFIAVGFVGLFVDGGLFNTLRIILANSYVSALVSGLVAMLVTFSLNNYWSFRDRKIKGYTKKFIKFGIYLLSSIVPIFVRTKLVWYFTRQFGDTFLVSNAAFFIGIVLGLIWNFTIYSKIIWRRKLV